MERLAKEKTNQRKKKTVRNHPRPRGPALPYWTAVKVWELRRE